MPSRILGSGLLYRAGGGGLSAPVYLIRDDFTTDASTPLAASRAADPGPGTLNTVQVDGQLSISTAKLNVPAQASAAWGDEGGYYDALARVAGRTLIVKVRYSAFSNGSLPAAWFTGAALNTTGTNNMAEAIGITTTDIFAQVAATDIGNALSTGVDYIIAITERTTGAWYSMLGGAQYPTWATLYTSSAGSQATLRPGFSNFNGAFTLDYLHVFDMPTPADAAAVLTYLALYYPN